MGYEITKTTTNIFGKIANIMTSKDDFDRNRIVSSIPKDWAYETKTDYLPDASNRQIAQPNPSVRATPAPVTPQYGTPANMPMSPITQGPVTQQPRGSVPGHANVNGVPQPQINTPPNNISPGTNPNTTTQRPNTPYMAMPPQGNNQSQTIIR